MSDSLNAQSSEWSHDSITTMPPYDPEVGPPPEDRFQPWYRWTFSLPFTLFVALFILFIYMSRQTGGEEKIIYIIGAVIAIILELVLVGLQWWDRYPYRIEHKTNHNKQNNSKETDGESAS